MQIDIIQLQQQVAALEKKDARIKFHNCGGRLCIETSRNQGVKTTKWKTPWYMPGEDVFMVIPEGY